ncbi:MAG: helix-turn-helix domain-containing protein, partial [Pyrinomonadaceae bacterium]
PLGRNDLQGSKMLINFCDSSFAIGESHKEPGLRYLKQIKARNAAIIYHSENVLLASVEKRENLLQFVFGETATEREHLKTASEKDKAELIKSVHRLAAEGMSSREIADEVGLSHTTVNRYLKDAKTGTPGTSGTAP